MDPSLSADAPRDVTPRDAVPQLGARAEGLQDPGMREALLGHLAELADPALQERLRARGEEVDPQRLAGDEFLCERGWVLADDPRHGVGLCLYDAAEAEAVWRVVDAMEAAYADDDVGLKAPPEAVVRSRLWPTVVVAAADALPVLRGGPPAV